MKEQPDRQKNYREEPVLNDNGVLVDSADNNNNDNNDNNNNDNNNN